MLNEDENKIIKETKRGFGEEDYRWFSEEAMEKLKKAQEEIQWLLSRGYKSSSLIDFIGGHYQFSSRQRTALQRATASSNQCRIRSEKHIALEALKGNYINIDGFNLIITLEVALSGGLLIQGNDEVIRDLAGLRGTYRLIDKTDNAIILIKQILMELGVRGVKFFLDAPVSNSGRLKTKILEILTSSNIIVEVELVPNADVILSKLEGVVTADSIILDECKSWVNLSRRIIEKYIKNAWVVKLQ
ncbi:DUF434 domain-containing protein [Candidatus Clostridium radicumherbarum]|uniref:DUF434 domain-containing protein n=1 Tax=Candidatus Clostridium radicumherbarum TaxID=3381662 RepID=A0ABW8TZN6_9CLOT